MINKNVFITGVDGFVGGHLAKNFLKQRYNIVGLVHDENPKSTLKLLDLDSKITKIFGDVCNERLIKRILSQYRINHVCHIAAQAIVSTALKDPITTFQVNCVGTATVLNACRDLQLDSILVSSTDKVFGEGLDRKEDYVLDGKGIYETSKICEDYIARSFYNVYSLPIVITRASNIYGEGDNNSRIIPNTVRDLKAGTPPIIFKEQKGNESLREYIYVDDVCDAYIKLIENIAITKGEVFNIGGHAVATQEEIVLKLISISGKNVKPYYKDKPKGLFEIHKQTVNSEKIKKVLKWAPKYNLDTGLKRTWDRWIDVR